MLRPEISASDRLTVRSERNILSHCVAETSTKVLSQYHDSAESKAVGAVRAALRRDFHGDLFCPGDARYLEARSTWNGVTARNPGLIARCRSVEDVQAAVRAAHSASVLTAIRCGGHSLAGFSTCEGGVVIDLSGMRSVSVDSERRRARFAGGCLLGDVDRATQDAGLVFPAGVVSQTGAAGLTLGGGFGWLTRAFGMSCDNVEGFNMVTADGSAVRANSTENADLFWALRGGGGNFGVVTEFEVRLYFLRSVLFGTAVCGGNDISRVLEYWRDFMPEAPDRLKWSLSLRLAPETENIPAHLHGQPIASESVLWAGDSVEGQSPVDHALSVCGALGITKEVIPFVKLQTMADREFPAGGRYYTKSGYLKTLDDHAIGCMVEALDSIPSPVTQIEITYHGGAAGCVGAGETAFGDRSSPFIINILGSWSEIADDATNVSWIRDVFAKLRPSMTPGGYVNFMSGDEDDRTTEAYRDRWDRLVAVKTHYDPDNFFRLNQNIPPRKREVTGGV
jgi:FAD binding domain/Berberine and berberine like